MGDGRARSLGWLTESAVQPRKRKEIEGNHAVPDGNSVVCFALCVDVPSCMGPSCPVGVGTTSLLSLRSQLASEQQKAAAVKTGDLDRAELRAKRLDIGLRSNPGVGARDARDRASVQTEQSLLAASAAALERKAELYDRLASGSQAVPEELYEVDFDLKAAPDTLSGAANAPAGLISADMEAERERQAWEGEVEANRRREHNMEERRRQRNEVRTAL